MSWKDNTIMLWDDAGTWVKVSDHGRGNLDTSYTRIGADHRVANGRLRRYSVAKKKSWQLSWDNLPSKHGTAGPVDSGLCGEELEDFYYRTDGEFDIQIRDGAGNVEARTVMITDFSKTVLKRSPTNDRWNLSITLEES